MFVPGFAAFIIWGRRELHEYKVVVFILDEGSAGVAIRQHG